MSMRKYRHDKADPRRRVLPHLWYSIARNWTIRRTAKDSRNIKLRGSTFKGSSAREPLGKYLGILMVMISPPMDSRIKVATTHRTFTMKYRNTAWKRDAVPLKVGRAVNLGLRKCWELEILPCSLGTSAPSPPPPYGLWDQQWVPSSAQSVFSRNRSHPGQQKGASRAQG